MADIQQEFLSLLLKSIIFHWTVAVFPSLSVVVKLSHSVTHGHIVPSRGPWCSQRTSPPALCELINQHIQVGTEEKSMSS